MPQPRSRRDQEELEAEWQAWYAARDRDTDSRVEVIRRLSRENAAEGRRPPTRQPAIRERVETKDGSSELPGKDDGSCEEQQTESLEGAAPAPEVDPYEESGRAKMRELLARRNRPPGSS
jgi:hypothetical protein